MKMLGQTLALLNAMHSIAMSCGIGCRHDLDPMLLRLWCRPATAALIQPLA